MDLCHTIAVDGLYHVMYSLHVLIILSILPVRERVVVVSDRPEFSVATDYVQELIETLYCIERDIQLSQAWGTHQALDLDKGTVG